MRSDVYLFLSRSLLFPQEPLDGLKQEAVASLQGLGREGLAQALADLPLPHLEELKREYLRVFGHGTSQDFPQYETESEKSHISRQSQALAEIAGSYRFSGLEVAQGEKLDHIGVELEFLYFLTHKEAYALGGDAEEKAEMCQGAQREFFRAHLGRWGPSFFRHLMKTEGFYGGLSKLAEGFLSWEGQLLGIDTEELSEDASRPENTEIFAGESSLCGEGCEAYEDCL
ncbi:MAG: molecular chaperone [Dehalococcoidia bacterium]